jgi:hypothetical protein
MAAKKPGEVVDQLFKTREDRLDLDRQSNELKEKERELKDWLLDNLSKQELTRLAGKLGQVSLKKSAVGTIEDLPAFQEFVKKHDAFDLYQRRLNLEACRLRWDAGKEIGGVKRDVIVDLTVSKVGTKL